MFSYMNGQFSICFISMRRFYCHTSKIIFSLANILSSEVNIQNQKIHKVRLQTNHIYNQVLICWTYLR